MLSRELEKRSVPTRRNAGAREHACRPIWLEELDEGKWQGVLFIRLVPGTAESAR